MDYNNYNSTELINNQACTELMDEGVNLQQLAINAKKRIHDAYQWIVKCAKYIKSIIIRWHNTNKAKRMQKQMDDLMNKQGWAVEFDDLPQDVYGDNFFEASDNSYLVGNYTENDIKSFAKEILSNKKLIIKTMCKIIPGGNTVLIAAETTKLLSKLIPVLGDFIVTSKEIAMLKKKYAGKSKKIRKPDGSIEMEIPAEEYIAVDNYIKLANRIINEICLPKGTSKNISIKISGTEDLIRIGKLLYSNSEQADDACNKIIDLYQKTANEISSNYSDSLAIDSAFQNALKSEAGHSALSSWNTFMSIMVDSMTSVISIYEDGIEYKINGKAINEILTSLSTQVVSIAMQVEKELLQMENSGDNCIVMVTKILGKVGPSIADCANVAARSLPAADKNMSRNKYLISKRKSLNEYSEIYDESTRTKNNSREKVIDGYLNDLPEDVQSTVMTIHKIVVETVNTLIKTREYSDLQNDKWAKEQLEEFCAMPTNKSDIGSVRVYQKGKKYRCMIQLTGHFTNHMEDFSQELMHEFIKNVFITIRPKIRKKFDVTITNEGDHGNPFEGFDLFTSKKVAEEIWNKLQDRTIRTVIEESGILDDIIDNISGYNKFTESSIQRNRVSGHIEDLPKGFQKFAIEINEEILEAVLNEMQRHKDFDSLDDDDVKELINWMDAKSNKDGHGYFFIEKDDKGFAGEMRLFPKTGKQFGYISKQLESVWNKSLKYVFDKKHVSIDKKDSTKKLTLVTDENIYTLVFVFSNEYAEKLFDYIHNPRKHPLTESANTETESYNVDMSEAEAKKTLAALTQSIIDNKKPISQYTANIYANIITKNLLPIWAKGYHKLSITIDDDNQKFRVFEFKIPTMTQDFVSRFIKGRETINGLLHRNPEIKIIIAPRLFNTIKDRNDAYNFFKAAIKYYDSQVEKYSMKMMAEVMKLNHEMKHLVSNTKLSALVTYPMTLLFAFDDLDMSSKDCFKIDQSDIAAVNKFIKGVYTNYASPEKEKKQIIEDLRSMVKALKESIDMDENLRNISYLPEAVNTLITGGFNNEINKVHNQFIHENTDTLWPKSSPDPQVKYLAEKFGVKKLKKIPVDLVAYIQIETESIRDANDKMMIASYCLSKIEIVEWYIELLEVGSKKYIVPHTKQYLETVRTQLLQCYKEIMATKITNANDKPLIDIKYPKGYEG